MLRSLTRLFPLLLSAPILLTPAGAQQAAPTPQQTPASSGITLKANSNLVVIDVVVTDNRQHPVHDLKASDFTLQEGGAQQQIRDFEEHTSAPVAKPAAMPTLTPGVFTNYTPVPSNGPLNILLIDTLNTPMDSQSYLRSQLLKFLKTAKPGQRIAIFGLTNTRLVLLQSFTSDPEILRAAVNKKSLDASPLLDDPMTGQKTMTASQMLVEHTDPKFLDAALIEMMKQDEAEQGAIKLDLRAKYTLNAMSQLARYLSNLPGRKNLIWFSGSFPISILPESPVSPGNEANAIQNPFAVIHDSEDQFRQTTNLFSRSQVAVYPVDARGLTNIYAGDLNQPPHTSNRSRKADIDDQSKALEALLTEQSTMSQMARETGGKAFVNTNGLSEAVDEAINSGSNYYTLTYTPTNGKLNGNFRKIEIKLARKGYTLSYRHGYYADDPSRTDREQGKPLATPANTVKLAMMRGSPEPSQIVFKTRVLPADAANAPTAITPTLIAGTLIGPNTKLSQGPYRNYLIDIGALSRTLSFTVTPEGIHHGAVEIMTIAFNQDGALITSTASSVHMDLPPDAYQQFLHNSLQIHQQISVPAKGDYYLRIGLHDTTNDHVGALEFPLDAIKNLPPDTVTAASPTPTQTPAQPQPK